jgi:Zn-dependent protease with chaperone function
MEAALLYLLKAHAVLALFAAAYYGLLRRLTFFTLNRAFLLLAVVVAVGYPLLPAPAALAEATAHLVPPLGLPEPATGALAALPAAPSSPPAAPFPWLLVGLGIYAAGCGWLGLRLLGQVLSLARLRQSAQLDVVLGKAVWLVPGLGGAFSFGNGIYLTSSMLSDAENLPAVLRHEQAHVQEAHTFDVLLLQLLVAVAWLNPAAWLLRRAVLDNLEYLADRAALPAGPGRYAYLRCLLSQQVQAMPMLTLAFRFTVPTLKNRILMLSQPPSSPRQLGRYLLAAPLLAASLLGLAGLVACERPQALAPTTPPTTVLLTKTTLKQPNGRPINVHLLNFINLCTESTNHYMLRMQSLSEEQRLANSAKIDSLVARRDSSRTTQEQLAKLQGFASLKERRALDERTFSEHRLLRLEDPGFFKMSAQDQRAAHKFASDYIRRTGGPSVVPPLPGELK